FFFSGPTVTSGSGAVTVANADGTGTFMGTSQLYFFYNQILPTGNVSAAKTWEWSVPATVRTFAFQVFVDAGAPQETAEKRSVLRWVPQLDGAWLRAIWGASSDTIFAVAS